LVLLGIEQQMLIVQIPLMLVPNATCNSFGENVIIVQQLQIIQISLVDQAGYLAKMKFQFKLVGNW
jgi:hypothetical protein